MRKSALFAFAPVAAAIVIAGCGGSGYDFVADMTTASTCYGRARAYGRRSPSPGPPKQAHRSKPCGTSLTRNGTEITNG
jgi:hypothetical protein